MRALLISQDPDEAAILSLILQRAGMAVNRSTDLEHALQNQPESPADLILLAMPAGSPLVQVRMIRAQTETPLVLVAEQVEEAVHALLLESGADLVVTRPFGARLLISQLRALLRRAAGLPFFTLPTLSISDLTLAPATRTVQIGNQGPKRLTQLEFRLLYALMIPRSQLLPAEILVEQVWGYTGEGERDLVRGLIRRLRAKVEPDPSQPRFILTIPGIGYTFDPQD